MVQGDAVSAGPFSLARLLQPRNNGLPDLRISYRRIFLRPPSVTDWQSWSELRELSRDFLTPWEPRWGKNDLTEGAYRQRLSAYRQDWQQGRSYSFFIFQQTDGCLLGGLNINNVRRGIVQSANFGYWLGQPHSGRGYMREALIAGLKFCFDYLDLHRVEAACLLNNQASRKALLAAGFQPEGLARSYLKINDQWQDHLTFAVLLSDVAQRLQQAQIKQR